MPRTKPRISLRRDDYREVPQAENDTTSRPISDDVRRTVALVSWATLLEDIAIATEVRERMAQEDGERIPLEEAIQHFGMDPREFGLE